MNVHVCTCMPECTRLYNDAQLVPTCAHTMRIHTYVYVCRQGLGEVHDLVCVSVNCDSPSHGCGCPILAVAGLVGALATAHTHTNSKLAVNNNSIIGLASVVSGILRIQWPSQPKRYSATPLSVVGQTSKCYSTWLHALLPVVKAVGRMIVRFH